jgi:DNA-binding response OmpR family regulator
MTCPLHDSCKHSPERGQESCHQYSSLGKRSQVAYTKPHMAHIITIIEDDDFLRSLAVSKLEKEGFTVETAADGEAGLALVQKKVPALLILDLMLPAMSGVDVLKKIKADASLAGMKIIIFSNLGEQQDIKTCMDLGANDYMVKANFTLDELVDKVKSLLG